MWPSEFWNQHFLIKSIVKNGTDWVTPVIGAIRISALPDRSWIWFRSCGAFVRSESLGLRSMLRLKSVRVGSRHVRVVHELEEARRVVPLTRCLIPLTFATPTDDDNLIVFFASRLWIRGTILIRELFGARAKILANVQLVSERAFLAVQLFFVVAMDSVRHFVVRPDIFGIWFRGGGTFSGNRIPGAELTTEHFDRLPIHLRLGARTTPVEGVDTFVGRAATDFSRRLDYISG